MTANDVRKRAPSPYGGSPARAFVMAHKRARCHRSQESARIGLAGGRGAQDIQSRQQDAHEGRHGDFDGGGRSSGAAYNPSLYAATALEAAAHGKPFFDILL